MKVKVGLIGTKNVTVTLYLDEGSEDTKNMHKGNYSKVALAVARRKLDCNVYPLEIAAPGWLPDAPAKGAHK